MMGQLNSFSAPGGRNLNKNFAKNTNAQGLPGGGGMLKLRFDWYIIRKQKTHTESLFAGYLRGYQNLLLPSMPMDTTELRRRKKETLNK